MLVSPACTADILLGPLEVCPELQNSVSQLCEEWWSNEGTEREGLVTHTLLYVVARSLTDGALVSYKWIHEIYSRLLF